MGVATTTTILWRSDAGHRGRPPHQSNENSSPFWHDVGRT